MSTTKKLFYEDSEQIVFRGIVEECCSRGDAFEICLDQTAFYPEGGGQPCDKGILVEESTGRELIVLDVQEREGKIWHTVCEAIEKEQCVTGKIDWEHRFDLTQQHSGEHMVSGLVHEAYGYENVGFHMGKDVITIDFSGVLTMEQLQEIEDQVNELIWKNREVEITWPSKEELSAIPYRSKKELTGDVRIVTYPEADICACCGTHVKRTGEIGMVRILSVEKFRAGVRVEMICGKRVQEYLKMVDNQNHKVSVLTSAKPQETAQAVERMQEELYRLRGKLIEQQNELNRLESERYKGKGDVLLLREEMEADQVRKLCDAVLRTCGGRCAVFSDNGDGSWKYAVGLENGDLREFTRRMNQELSGRGGGKPFFVQGSVQTSREKISGFFEA